MVGCGDLLHLRAGSRVVVPGIVLVQQKPGSAKGVMFITIEDETRVANLVLWADRFEAQRRLVLSAGMIVYHGRVQREGNVIHVVTDRLEDLSDLLRSVGERDGAFPIRYGRGDGATHPAGRDPRSGPGAGPGRRLVRDTYVPDGRLGSGIQVPTRDFRYEAVYA
jgi:error-prone DNA polymerase